MLKELAEKTKELEQIIYVTSHDLRSPLVNIQGFAKELEQSLEEVRSAGLSKAASDDFKKKIAVHMDEDIPEAFKYIFSSISKMDSLLSGLLRLSRLGRAALNIQDLDMNELVTEVKHTFEFNIQESGARLEIDDLPSCRGDRTQMNQVFSNLIGNALKFLDAGRPGIVRVSGIENNDQVVFCVEDNGIGIAPEYHSRIFEIFQRLEPDKNTGEGLGLTIVQRILSRHSGKIWLESEPGKGSKFFVSLPAVQRKGEEVANVSKRGSNSRF